MKTPRSPFSRYALLRPALRDNGPAPATRGVRQSAPALARFSSGVLEGLARQTRFVDPALIARWSELAGPEISRLCRPGRLTGGRQGRTLEVIVPHGAAAASVEFASETLRRRLNAYFGPEAIVRIAVIQGVPQKNPGAAGGKPPASGQSGAPGGAPGNASGGGLSRFRRG